MFKLKTHQNIKYILDNLNKKFLNDNHCFFGGGTALSLLLGEYRESKDIDFLCSSKDGFRELRSTSSNLNLGNIININDNISYERDVTQNRDKIKTILKFNNQRIKIEFVKMEEFNATGKYNNNLDINILDKDSLFISKLLAAANRGIDKSTNGRDMIDIAIMIDNWGFPSLRAIDESIKLYDRHLIRGLNNSKKVLEDNGFLLESIKILKMDKKWEIPITKNTEDLLLKVKNRFELVKSQSKSKLKL